MNYLSLSNWYPFTKKYAYIDTKDHFLDQILIDYGIPVRFLGDYSKDGVNYRIIFIKINKHYCGIMENKVFPELDSVLTERYGEDYTNFIEIANKIVEEYKK